MVPYTCRLGAGGAGRDSVTRAAEPPGEGLPATASEKRETAVLSPRRRLLLQAAARLSSQGRLEHQRRGAAGACHSARPHPSCSGRLIAT